MAVSMNWFDKLTRTFSSSELDEQFLEPAFLYHDKHLPTLWLLGKTGAGKSTLVQSITGNSDAEIGLGFKPCTQTSEKFGFPTQKPVLQFLDTRGLGEAGYDASEDIKFCGRHGHALIIVMKVGDTQQQEVLHAISQIKSSQKFKNFLLVHTATHGVSDLHERNRLVNYNLQQVQDAIGCELPAVTVDFKMPDGGMFGMEELIHELSEMLPVVSVLLKTQQSNDEEVKKFNELQAQVIRYSGVAGVSDLVPGIGLVAVPGIQWKMLREVAESYNTKWDKETFAELIGALGAGIGVRYTLKFGTRQAVKFLPAWGQTVGAASAAVMSFCTTYAIGRVACKYLHHKNHQEEVSDDELRALFHSAFDSVRTVTHQEMGVSAEASETTMQQDSADVETDSAGENRGGE